MHPEIFAKSFLKAFTLVICFSVFNAEFSLAQNAGDEQQKIITRSKDKWQWMADKNVDKRYYNQPFKDESEKVI